MWGERQGHDRATGPGSQRPGVCVRWPVVQSCWLLSMSASRMGKELLLLRYIGGLRGRGRGRQRAGGAWRAGAAAGARQKKRARGRRGSPTEASPQLEPDTHITTQHLEPSGLPAILNSSVPLRPAGLQYGPVHFIHSSLGRHQRGVGGEGSVASWPRCEDRLSLCRQGSPSPSPRAPPGNDLTSPRHGMLSPVASPTSPAAGL